MLYKYPCGCIGLKPDGSPHGPVILMACDSSDDGLPSNLSRVVGYRRSQRDEDKARPLTSEGYKEYFAAIGGLKKLASVGQQYVNLAETSRRISEVNDEGTP